MGRLLIIGCGGVAGVAIHKCCQNSKTFSEICIASRTKAKCDALKEKLENTTETKITTAQVDADKVEELIALIQSYQPDAVLNNNLTKNRFKSIFVRYQLGALYMLIGDTNSSDNEFYNILQTGSMLPCVNRIKAYNQTGDMSVLKI